MPHTDTPTPISDKFRIGPPAMTVTGYQALLYSHRKLERDRAGLMDCLERIADSIAIGTSSKQMPARIGPIFQAIEDEARAALKAAKGEA